MVRRYVPEAGMLCCPMTKQIKGCPFEVSIAGDRPSAVLADQVKSRDWVVRKASHKGKISSVELSEVKAKILALIGKPRGWPDLVDQIRRSSRFPCGA